MPERAQPGSWPIKSHFADFIEEDWDSVVDTNLKSLFFLSQAADWHMATQSSGKIVNIASLLRC